jgi:hypothetical protein
MDAERQYLTQALSGLLDGNALEPVVEYLLSFPKDQPQHLLDYLTELLGHQPVSMNCACCCEYILCIVLMIACLCLGLAGLTAAGGGTARGAAQGHKHSGGD